MLAHCDLDRLAGQDTAIAGQHFEFAVLDLGRLRPTERQHRKHAPRRLRRQRDDTRHDRRRDDADGEVDGDQAGHDADQLLPELAH